MSEEKARELLDEAPCGFLSTLPDGEIRFVNATFVEWSGRSPEELLGGVRFQDLLTVPGRIYYETHFAPLLHMQGEVRGTACYLASPTRPPLPILLNSRLKRDQQGRPELIRTSVFDASDRNKYEEELRNARKQAEERAAIVNYSADAIISTAADGTVLTWNRGAEAMFGFTATEAIGQQIVKLIIPPDRLDEFKQNRAQLLRDGVARQRDTSRCRRDKTEIEVSAQFSPIRDQAGNLSAVSVIYRDITDRRRSEEHIKLLLHEVNHRSKNMLSLVQAVARHSAAGDPEHFLERFSARLRALAANQDLLVANDWKGTEIDALVRSQLAHFEELVGNRIKLSGPPLQLSTRAAQTIGMVLHELATNASKYGALSNNDGFVSIAWRVEKSNGCNNRFILDWREENGPAVRQPTTTGFGSTVILKMAKLELDAEVQLEYAETGLRWNLISPASSVLSDA